MQNTESTPTSSPIPTIPTIESLVRGLRIRKGKADGTTKNGAFWLVKLTYPLDYADSPTSVQIRHGGGDGIGQNAGHLRAFLTLRHYRNDEVHAVVKSDDWHQNHGTRTEFYRVKITDCTTIEDVIVRLKGTSVGEFGMPVFGDGYVKNLTNYLTALGLPEADPAPDEQPAV